MSSLVIMGSGETAPAMVKTHRAVTSAAGVPDLGPAAMLDTTFGFQANADELVATTRLYFAESVGVQVETATWRSSEVPAAQQESTLALLSRARGVCAGPGSPSYALRQWRDTAVPGALLDVADRGGTLVFGSAAACTVGRYSVPVYEIYKVGAAPYLDDGLDLLGRLTGIEALVVPHYNNAEGGRYDTRFCYLGETRLAALEQQLPDQVGVLGVDEHTALVIDLDAATATVRGNGGVTLRRRGHDRVLAAGETIGLPELAAVLRGEQVPGAGPAVATDSGGPTGPDHLGDPAGTAGAPSDGSAEAGPASLAGQADQARADFEAALTARDVAGCVAAVLALEEAIHSWRTDTLQSDETDRARRLLRALVVRLGELAERGAADPADAVRPFVGTLLDLRARSRAERDFATSDLIRDRLTQAGVEVRDTPDGATWALGPRPDAG